MLLGVLVALVKIADYATVLPGVALFMLGTLVALLAAILIANANVDRFLGLVLLVSLVVGFYLVVQEISRAMGKGALFSLFFEPPLESSRPLAGPDLSDATREDIVRKY